MVICLSTQFSSSSCQLPARYEILRSCIKELIRVNLIVASEPVSYKKALGLSESNRDGEASKNKPLSFSFSSLALNSNISGSLGLLEICKLLQVSDFPRLRHKMLLLTIMLFLTLELCY